VGKGTTVTCILPQEPVMGTAFYAPEGI